MSGHGKRVLIVEPDNDMVFILRKALSDSGYLVETCDNGTAVVERSMPWPDVFIIDKDLPTIDGIAICKFLRVQSATKEIPVILISTHSIKTKAERAGADAFLTKPFELNRLIETLNAFAN